MTKQKKIIDIIDGINEVHLNYLLLFLGGIAIGLWLGYFAGIIQC